MFVVVSIYPRHLNVHVGILVVDNIPIVFHVPSKKGDFGSSRWRPRRFCANVKGLALIFQPVINPLDCRVVSVMFLLVAINYCTHYLVRLCERGRD